MNREFIPAKESKIEISCKAYLHSILFPTHDSQKYNFLMFSQTDIFHSNCCWLPKKQVIGLFLRFGNILCLIYPSFSFPPFMSFSFSQSVWTKGKKKFPGVGDQCMQSGVKILAFHKVSWKHYHVTTFQLRKT